MSQAQTKNLALHPEAGRVPEMRPEEWRAFVMDIEERGIRVPIEVLEDGTTIIDGRSRWKAAQELGVEYVPTMTAKINGDDPVVYMIRAASKRRQLTDDQRACLASEEMEYLADKGREERKAKLVPGAVHKSFVGMDVIPTNKSAEKQRAREIAAKNNNVPQHKVQNAAVLRRLDPELHQEVKEGKKPLAEAVREVRRERGETARPIDPDTFADDADELPPVPDGPTPEEIVRADPFINLGKMLQQLWSGVNSFHFKSTLKKLKAGSSSERKQMVKRINALLDELGKLKTELE